MAFDVQIWRKRLSSRMEGWKGRWEQARSAGVPSLYAFLSAMALWPVVEAARQGEWAALAELGGVAAGVGGNLLANQIQSWKDEADAARQLDQAAQENEEIRAALDAVLEHLHVVAQAQAGLDDVDQAWFAKMLRAELARLGNLGRYDAVLIGSGAIAQGPGARAVGEGGVLVEGDVAGDVIAPGATKVVGPPPAAKQRADEAFVRYLHNLRRLCNALPLAALAEEEGPHRRAEITLNRVYIALNTTTQLPLAEEEQTRRRETFSALRTEARPIPVLEAAVQESRLVLLGDPGSGKSTFVNYLAYLLAGARLGEADLPEDWPHGPLLPVRVILRELVGHLPGDQDLQRLSAEKRKARLVSGFWMYLRQELEATYRAEEVLEVLERDVDEGRALVIFDGLDEVAPERRGVVRETVEAFCQLCGTSRVLATCRVRSYQGEACLPAFADFTLAPFEEEQVNDFVRCWYRALADLGALKSQEADRRAENLREAVQPLMELARNPLLLTTMAVVHTAQVELPRERARLYQRCVEVLLRRWHKHKAGEVPLLNRLGVSESELLGALREVAYRAHAMGGVREGDLPRSEVLRVLADHLEGKYGKAEQFLDYVDARAGLLVGRGGVGEPIYTFPHRTFQEYLAGCHLALGGRDFGRRLRGMLGEGDRWALAVHLGAEHLLYNVGKVTEVLDAAYALCPVAEPETEADWRGVLWAGCFTAEMGLRKVKEDVEAPDGGTAFAERLVPRLVRVLREVPLGPLERAEAGNVLSQLGDPRFREDAWYLPDERLLGFVEIPAGLFLMGTRREDIPELLERFGGDRDWYESETPRHEVTLPAYYVARYLVTYAQYAAFVRETGQKLPEEWREGNYPPQRANQPVVLVTWYDALAYCRWLTGKLRAWPGTPEPLATRLREEGWVITLPSEAEWEKAARGTDGWIFPWGEEPDPYRANYGDTGIGTTSAVGCFPGGGSPYGVEDLSGNVWEWTRSLYGEYPYVPGDGREDLEAGREVRRVLRGGAFFDVAGGVRCAYRVRLDPSYRSWFSGFRLVASPVRL